MVSFGAGEPDFDTPQFIKDAAKAALDAGDTKYTARSAGACCKAIADKLQRENGLTVRRDQVSSPSAASTPSTTPARCWWTPATRCSSPRPTG